MNLSDKNLRMLRSDALHLFKDAIKTVDAYSSIVEHLSLKNNIFTVSDIFGKRKIYDLSKYKNIYVVGAGKASAKMSEAVEAILGERISAGLVITKYKFSNKKLKRIKIDEAAHPVPDENGIKATERIIEICKKASKNDLLIFLLSGGASSLLTYPEVNISLNDLQHLNQMLLDTGLSIHEMNAIRKQVSKVKGGKLAEIARPADILTLVISDVIGDNVDIIGSAPTKSNSATADDALKILLKYNLMKKIPSSVKDFILAKKSGKDPNINERNVDAVEPDIFIIANNQMALNGIRISAEKLGYKAEIVSNTLSGEARVTAKEIVESVFEKTISDIKQCFIFGGETTVTIKGNGKGGRNQELCLAAAINLKGMDNIVLLSCGTDGNDGPTDAAGAICDGKTILRAEKLKLNADCYLKENNSYNFFSKLNNLVKIQPTQTNVMDVVIVLTI